jgi:hypothetical protein
MSRRQAAPALSQDGEVGVPNPGGPPATRTPRPAGRPGRKFTVHRAPHPLVAAAVLLVTGSCSSLGMGVKHDSGLVEVDELLGHVERVQVEAAVSKERGYGALDKLRVLLAPEFRGDPAVAHVELVTAIEESEDQAKALQKAVKPLRKTGEKVFAQWTANLESFGNLAMRQRSQERLEETRRRHDGILAAAVAAQLAFDAYNGDLGDHALFLEHDFNATSVAMIAPELEGLRARGKELGRRLDLLAAACDAYVEFSAPTAQLAPASGAAAEAPAPAARAEAEAAPLPAVPATRSPRKKPAQPTTPTSGTGG